MEKSVKWTTSYMISYIIMLFLNYWSATDVGIVADQEQAIIQPAGYTFSIWGLIYVMLFVWIAKLFLKKSKEVTDELSFWPIVNFLLNGLWIVVFTMQQVGISVLVILGLLLTVIVMYRKLNVSSFHWIDRLPFSVYFGWVTVAVVVNIFTWLNQMNMLNFFGLDELVWTIIGLVITLFTCLFVAYKFTDGVYSLVFVWAYVGIFVENQYDDLSLAVVLFLCIAFQIFISVRIFFKRSKRPV